MIHKSFHRAVGVWSKFSRRRQTLLVAQLAEDGDGRVIRLVDDHDQEPFRPIELQGADNDWRVPVDVIGQGSRTWADELEAVADHPGGLREAERLLRREGESAVVPKTSRLPRRGNNRPFPAASDSASPGISPSS
jgi:hypothetical protein